MIYLDNAATSWPKPEIVYKTLSTFLREKGGNPGRASHSMAIAAGKVVEETRLSLTRLINAPDKDRMIFTLNCTESINLGLKGLLKPGDHIITDRIGHNSISRPLSKLEKQGVKITRIGPSSTDGVVSAHDLEKEITNNTKLIIVTHASNVTGVIQPVTEYGEIARKHGVIFMVDAAQTAGSYPVNIQKSNIDLIAFSGHKGLLGPPGTGVLYIGKNIDLDPLKEGGTGSHSDMEEQPYELPQRYESGTLNTLGIAGLGSAVNFILEESVEKIRQHEKTLVDHLLSELNKIPEIVIYGPRDSSKQVAIVSFNLKSWEPGEAGAILDQSFDIKVRTGLFCAPAAHKTFGTYPKGCIRIGMGYFNNHEEIDFTVNALKQIVESRAI
jgi:cysteine desulfurase family protein